MQIREACGKDFIIYCSCDKLGSTNIAIGVDGINGSFYNCNPSQFQRICDAVYSNDMHWKQNCRGEL